MTYCSITYCRLFLLSSRVNTKAHTGFNVLTVPYPPNISSLWSAMLPAVPSKCFILNILVLFIFLSTFLGVCCFNLLKCSWIVREYLRQVRRSEKNRERLISFCRTQYRAFSLSLSLYMIIICIQRCFFNKVQGV